MNKSEMSFFNFSIIMIIDILNFIIKISDVST